MTKEEIDYAVISNAVDTISVTCAGNRDKIIDLLADYLFTEDEAEKIKQSSGRFDIVKDFEKSYEDAKNRYGL